MKYPRAERRVVLFAVHISDGVLEAPACLVGFVGAAALVWLGLRRLRDEEIPRIALLTAAFFISSLVHVRVGPTSVHLLLNGLVGVLLGWRAAPAIAVGLLLQVVLLQHGGYSTLGVNTEVLTIPALLGGVLFRALHRLAWLRTPPWRSLLVALAALLLFFSGAYSLVLLKERALGPGADTDWPHAHAQVFHPLTLSAALLFAAAAAWFEQRLENAPEFPLGLLIGELSVLLTVGLSGYCLLLSGEMVPLAVLAWMAMHLPIAVIEGVILGFTVGFLAKVKPELLEAAPVALEA